MTHPLATPLQHELGASQKYAGSQHIGVLPLGCIQCREGAKMVLFITGLCDKECFYCPVSRDKMYRDVVYANERAVHIGDWDAIIDEANLIGAKGAGITGGDPMVVPDRVVDLCKLMKAEFGPEFHLHLYTSCAFDTKWIAKMKEAGLDEIRFHPELREYKDMDNSWHHDAIAEAIKVGLTTNVEIPAVPGKEADILALCEYLERVGAEGLNMNELEFSDPNIASLKRFGYKPLNDESQCVEGSRPTALAVLDEWRTNHSDSKFTVHFCSSPYKDAIQLMQRLRRRAERTARPFEEQTEEGTLVFGAVRSSTGESPGLLAERMRAEYEVPAEWIAIEGDRVETSPSVAQVLADEGALEDLEAEAWLSEVYPTADRLEVERVPLPTPAE
jgi:pyruvate formate-lyase activating enzyme-like uncharacterized protein